MVNVQWEMENGFDGSVVFVFLGFASHLLRLII
jgi:hypothetical protein